MINHSTTTGFPVLHAIDGRVRLSLAENGTGSGAVEQFLQGHPGLRKVRVNLQCRCVTIGYDPARWSAESLCALLTAQGFLSQAPVEAPPSAAVPAPVSSISADGPPGYELWLSSAGLGLLAVTETVVAPALLLIAALPMARRAYDMLVAERTADSYVLDTTVVTVLAMQGAVPAAGIIVWLVNLADHIRQANIRQWRRSLREALPDPRQEAAVLRDGRVMMVPLGRTKTGDTLVYRAGDRLAVDGIVVKGRAGVDESALTGDPSPAAKHELAAVFAGSLLLDGELHLKLERSGSATRLARAVSLAESTNLGDTALQAYAAGWSKDWVMAGFAGAGLGAVVAGLPGATAVLVTAKYLLHIVDHATRTQQTVPAAASFIIAKALRRGIVVPSAGTLERLAAVNVVVIAQAGLPAETGGDGMAMRAVVLALRARGIQGVIVVTDRPASSLQPMAEELGVTVVSKQGPQAIDPDLVRNLRGAGYRVAVLADRKQGAAMLAQADVPMAPDDEEDGLDGVHARGHAPVLLLKGGPWKIPAAIDLGREAVGLMEQHWRLVPVPNVLAWPLAAAGLAWPPAMAALAAGYYGSHAMATANGLRLLWDDAAVTRRAGNSDQAE